MAEIERSTDEDRRVDQCDVYGHGESDKHPFINISQRLNQHSCILLAGVQFFNLCTSCLFTQRGNGGGCGARLGFSRRDSF